MLASVLNSPIAVNASVEVVRAFVRMREVIAGHRELARRLDVLEKQYTDHDQRFAAVFEALRALMDVPAADRKRERIGFRLRPHHKEKCR